MNMNLSQSSLRLQQHPFVRQLADSIEHIWHDNLTVGPYHVPDGLGYIENQIEEEKLTIENRCYQAPRFRKLHLELAQLGNGFDILHCVMFPDPSYPLPIFGCDIVGAQGRISAAIVDLSPVSADRSLPATYHLALSQLPQITFENPRDLPKWGDIFSRFCTFIRPVNQAENQLFMQRVQNILELHCKIANVTESVTSTREKDLIISRQAYYCNQQRRNDKTRRILEKSLGSDWTEHYMTAMLFDT